VPAAEITRLKTDQAYLAEITQRFKADAILNVLPPAEALALYRKLSAAQNAA